MHKCHNYHAILHKLYMWFGKNEQAILKQSKKISIGGGVGGRGPSRGPSSKYTHATWITYQLSSVIAGEDRVAKQTGTAATNHRLATMPSTSSDCYGRQLCMLARTHSGGLFRASTSSPASRQSPLASLCSLLGRRGSRR